MPKRRDIKNILIIGAGPIIIGQACEFDYSGTQACKALKEEGYRVILVNSNPATIMTDPDTADVVYIEPLTVAMLEKIIHKEHIDTILPTLGGQTALNLAMRLAEAGVLERYRVKLIGADVDVIHKAEDREAFKQAMAKIKLDTPRSATVTDLASARQVARDIGYPCIVRPAFTMGGTGGGIAHSEQELEAIVASGLQNSLITQVLLEESIIGWKEFELEVMRDKNDNVVIICSIENLDPMGVHTGDSITVAPVQTLTDQEYQLMRNAAIAIMAEIGVETGGSNVQFAFHPQTGRMIVIEMNPRVSRSSALASKATGFPIAKLAAKLAVGYTLDELKNDITKETPACFEPTIDYVVTKIPRFNFEKFPRTPSRLGTVMKSVGETMAIGRTFKESLQKGLRSLETKRHGFGYDGRDLKPEQLNQLIEKLKTPNAERLFYIKQAFETGMIIEQVYKYTQIDPWFLYHMKQIVDTTQDLTDTEESIREAKEMGFSDHQLARLLGYENELAFRRRREELEIRPVYKLVDTCSGEFEAYTPYYYSTYELEDEVKVSDRPKVMILGGGPNRIGQGIEFDYCCVHASFAAREAGYETIMVNSNPETVSTDFDTSDKLYFEPLTFEDVMNINDKEQPDGVIVQFGGQTPLNLAFSLAKAGVKILGTSPESIDRAEDREKFKQLLNKLSLTQPDNRTIFSSEEAQEVAEMIGYPVVVRPSYVLGGASMEICYGPAELNHYIRQAQDISTEHPILIDKYLEDAIEVDVDALADKQECVIAGIMEHIEEAGIHSGDSACVLPPFSLGAALEAEISAATKAIAKELEVIGLLNIQFAVQAGKLFVLEVNPRGSRTVPFVSKATGVQWAKMATYVMLGQTIQELGLKEVQPQHWSVKEAVLPFNRFPGSDTVLGPEMKSTGEVMGIDMNLDLAYFKAQLAAGQVLPMDGRILAHARGRQCEKLVPALKQFLAQGYQLLLTPELGGHFEPHPQISSADLDQALDQVRTQQISLLLNLPAKDDSETEIGLRQEVLLRNIPYITTVRASEATARALAAVRQTPIEVESLHVYLGQ